MNSDTRRLSLSGPAGTLECALDDPVGPPRGLALICHPHPQFGGTLDNKVVQTLARALVQEGWRAARFNFRGVGESAGSWDEGRGEVEDALAVMAALREPGQGVLWAGFSFGAAIAAQAAARSAGVQRLVLVAPAVSRFAVPLVAPDTLVLHGESDDVVGLKDVLDWARPQGLPVVVLPGVGHFFHGQLPRLKALVAQALRG